MNRTEMLARLMTQNISAAATPESLLTLRAMIEEASEMGAERALARLGLSDDGARDDIDELRELLRAWRDAKKGAWKAVMDWLIRGCLALLLVGIAVRLGLTRSLA